MKDKEYFEMLDKARNGYITQEEWFEYCQNLLAEAMERNADVLKRLAQ